jgi:nucleotide-binding universal stress UspA family protein
MALQWKSICMPTDFSEASRPAFRTAIELAAHFDAELLLLYVPEITAMAYSVVPRQGRVRDEIEDAFRLLGDWKGQAEAQGARRTSVTMVSGQGVSDEIVPFAARHDADLIVMGTHGRTGLAHVLMGSVAEEVVRHAKCPVLTIRSPTRPTRQEREARIKRSP